MREVYNLFFNAGEVCEIRAYGLRKSSSAWEGWASGAGIVFGYFNNADDFEKAAKALDNAGAPGIYFTINPVSPDLLARAANRLKAADAKSKTTSDADIKCIRWLPLDIDSGAPAGVSATDEEIKGTKALRKQIWEFLSGLGFETGVPAFSGNGYHLCYRLPDLENNPENKEKIKKCLHAISQNVSSDSKASLDLGVFNPARIWKLYGTLVKKGDSIPERPHRRSFIPEAFLEKEAVHA